jgi:hypothetical protein
MQVGARLEQPTRKLASQVMKMQIADLGSLAREFPRGPNGFHGLANLVPEYMCG